MLSLVSSAKVAMGLSTCFVHILVTVENGLLAIRFSGTTKPFPLTLAVFCDL